MFDFLTTKYIHSYVRRALMRIHMNIAPVHTKFNMIYTQGNLQIKAISDDYIHINCLHLF